MHGSVMTYVGHWVGALALQQEPTLEVGSFDVNGSVRQFFTGPFVGVDMREGPGVDKVALANDLPFDDASFVVVVSTEMLEHDTRPWKSVAEMARVCQVGGYVIITARGYDERGCFPIHDYPDDNWRFSCNAAREMLLDAGLTVVDLIPDPGDPGFCSVARKG
jgi:SAM-dependent methyltransferase